MAFCIKASLFCPIRLGTLTSIIIPNSVTTIGDYAFYGCTHLISIIIPDSVISIGNAVFANCERLVSIIIPSSVTSIGDDAFSGCRSLTSIIIPDSITSIGDAAFYGCSGLTSIIIPDSVTTIGNYAFYGCSSLTSIIIPDSVTSIGDFAFFTNLISFSFVDFCSRNGTPRVREYSTHKALLCRDDEGFESFIYPPKSSDALTLVDFTLSAEEIARQISVHKNELKVLQGTNVATGDVTYTLVDDQYNE